jgi:hypothetical protein
MTSSRPERLLDVVVAKRLYEEDFYAWTQAQAELLRNGNIHKADIANILEEIETLGRKEVAELRSRLKVLVQHLLKEIYQPEKASRSWAVTIVNQRQEIARHINDNPSLKPRTVEIFAQAYADARRLAAAESGLPQDLFPAEAPFSYDQAVDEAFWPGRPLNQHG